MKLLGTQGMTKIALLLCVALTLQLGLVASQQQGSDEIFSNCNVEDYYQAFLGTDPSLWTSSDIHQLLRQTHRNFLPYSSSTLEDVWGALIDLDASSEDPDSVHLIYRDIDVPAMDFGDPTTWNREHLWPRSRGVSNSGPDNTDIHALRPSDWNVNSARGNLFFGDCASECTFQPATPEAAPDTAKNQFVFLPPASVRGDIARALMYMALRYSSADEPFTTRLELTDCPDLNNNGSQMAYLSELLKWHWDDPPDDRERRRNDRACSRWQGNRNVFVDFPQLATSMFGVPAARPYFCEAEESTMLPSNQPTAQPSNQPSFRLSNNPSIQPAESENGNNLGFENCANLQAGDVQVVAFNSDNPDSVTLVAMEDLPADLELFMTDNAWTGNAFRSTEGTVMLRIPSGGIAQGQIFGYGEDSNDKFSDSWVTVHGGTSSFALATAGDSLILYCQSSSDTIVPLGAFTTGEWQEESRTFTSNESALPLSLQTIGSTETLSTFDNYAYTGIVTGTKNELLLALGDAQNWTGSNLERQTFVGQFDIIEGGSSTQSTTDGASEDPVNGNASASQDNPNSEDEAVTSVSISSLPMQGFCEMILLVLVVDLLLL